jgi:hypothetical protein
MYNIIYKPTHDSDSLRVSMKAKHDWISVIDTLEEQGSLIMAIGWTAQ